MDMFILKSLRNQTNCTDYYFYKHAVSRVILAGSSKNKLWSTSYKIKNLKIDMFDKILIYRQTRLYLKGSYDNLVNWKTNNEYN